MANTVDTRAKELLTSITDGLDFSVPNVDFDDASLQIPESLAEALQKVPEQLTNDSLTEGCIEGEGTFDQIMKALKDHLTDEFEAGRITGAEYTKAYVAMMQTALQSAVQYLLGRDTAYYQALGAQAQALTLNIGAYTAKVQLAIAQAQALQNKAQYANTVLNLAATDKQMESMDKQMEHVDKQMEVEDAQIRQTNAQVILIGEQSEQAHAQVSDTMRDGSTRVTGYTGNQNALLKQQVIAFKKDSVIKAAKIYADSFATQISMSTATAAGTGLDANGIGTAISKLASSMSTD
jgi:hypothetical protein